MRRAWVPPGPQRAKFYPGGDGGESVQRVVHAAFHDPNRRARSRPKLGLAPDARRSGPGLFALLPLAPSALAAQTLSISTPYPSVTVAPGSKVSMDLTVRTTDAAQVARPSAGRPRTGRPRCTAAD